MTRAMDPPPSDGPRAREVLSRVLFGGRRLRDLEQVLRTGEVFRGPGRGLEVVGKPEIRRSIIPTIRLMQVELDYDDPTDPNPATVVYTFTSTETVDESLAGLAEFLGIDLGPIAGDPVEPRTNEPETGVAMEVPVDGDDVDAVSHIEIEVDAEEVDADEDDVEDVGFEADLGVFRPGAVGRELVDTHADEADSMGA